MDEKRPTNGHRLRLPGLVLLLFEIPVGRWPLTNPTHNVVYRRVDRVPNKILPIDSNFFVEKYKRLGLERRKWKFFSSWCDDTTTGIHRNFMAYVRADEGRRSRHGPGT